MTELESCVITRLLTFCQDRQLIGQYEIGDSSVQFVVESESRTFTLRHAIRYLVNLTGKAGLSNELYQLIDDVRNGRYEPQVKPRSSRPRAAQMA